MISADSHVTEHPDTYRNYIDPSLRDRAPHLTSSDAGGDGVDSRHQTSSQRWFRTSRTTFGSSCAK